MGWIARSARRVAQGRAGRIHFQIRSLDFSRQRVLLGNISITLAPGEPKVSNG
jgi:hypothetical protein